MRVLGKLLDTFLSQLCGVVFLGGWRLKISPSQIDRLQKTPEFHHHSQSHSIFAVTTQVPGLAENRPSVLRGDHLFAKLSDGSEEKEYKGYVHVVEEKHVQLGFGPG